MPLIADIAPIARALAPLQPGESIAHGALAVVPLLGPALAEPDWITLGEAGDLARVTEVDDAGAVPVLKVANAADQPLLLVDGEELVGAKQNRVLNTTVLVGARTVATIPVSCVERGRWRYRGRTLSSSESSLYASLRRSKAAWVTRSIREGRGHASDQGSVWAMLASKAAEHGVESPTGAMRDVYARFEDDLAGACRTVAAAAGQVGAIVYVAGRWVGTDVAPTAGVFARIWPRLCAGYAAEALGRAPRRRRVPNPLAVLRRITSSPLEPAPAIALGTEYRLVGREAAGAVLVAGDRLVHLMAFPPTPLTDRAAPRV